MKKIAIIIVSIIVIAALAVGGAYIVKKNTDTKATSEKETNDKNKSTNTNGIIAGAQDKADITNTPAPYRLRVENVEELYGTQAYLYIDGEGYEELDKNLQLLTNARIQEVKTEFDRKDVDMTNDDYTYQGYVYNNGVYFHRADENVLSFDYNKTSFEFYEYHTYNYDVKTGKKLKLVDVVTNTDEIIDIASEKLKEEYYNSSSMMSLLNEKRSYDSSFDIDEAIEECVSIRKEEMKNQLVYGLEKEEIEAPICHDSFCDKVVWCMKPTGILISWKRYFQMVAVINEMEVLIDYDELKSFNKEYAYDDSELSGQARVDETLVCDVNGDGKNEEIKDMLYPGRLYNYFYTKTSDGQFYALGFINNIDEPDSDESYVTRLFNLTSGKPVECSLRSGKDLIVYSVKGDYAFAKDTNTNEMAYYRITKSGFKKADDLYTDEMTESKWKEGYRKIVLENRDTCSQYYFVEGNQADVPVLVGILNDINKLVIFADGLELYSKYDNSSTYDQTDSTQVYGINEILKMLE